MSQHMHCKTRFCMVTIDSSTHRMLKMCDCVIYIYIHIHIVNMHAHSHTYVCHCSYSWYTDEDLQSYTNILSIFNEVLTNYNDEQDTRMNLVLFQDALEHVTRIHRIIRLPRGNALLVGFGMIDRSWYIHCEYICVWWYWWMCTCMYTHDI